MGMGNAQSICFVLPVWVYALHSSGPSAPLVYIEDATGRPTEATIAGRGQAGQEASPGRASWGWEGTKARLWVYRAIPAPLTSTPLPKLIGSAATKMQTKGTLMNHDY